MRAGARGLFVLTTASLTALCIVTAEASNVVHMTLRDLVNRADRIMRGRVIASDEDTVMVGGGSLPIVVYRIRVDESLKGAASPGEVVEVRMVRQPKQATSGPYRRGGVLRDLPRFDVGRDYLFVLTRPSAVGLSTTVGLGQGLFELRGRPGQETAVNEANNLGLFAGIQGAPQAPGPVDYSMLAKHIQALLPR